MRSTETAQLTMLATARTFLTSICMYRNRNGSGPDLNSPGPYFTEDKCSA